MTAALLSFAAALAAMMNPLGNAGIFATMTADQPRAAQRRIARKAAVAAAGFGLATLWAGPALLGLFGVTLPGLRAAGGLVVLLIGLSMLRGDRSHSHSAPEADQGEMADDPSVVPIAMPLLVGPGTMATIIATAGHAAGLPEKLAHSAVILGICAVAGALFSFAGPLALRLGPAGLNVVTRVMGLVLAALAAGMIAEGVVGLIPALARAR